MKLFNLKKNKSSTLVEVLIAMLIIAIVAIGGFAFFFQGSFRVGLERNRRAALEIANGRLELMRSIPFSNIEPPIGSYDIHFLIYNGGESFSLSSTDPGETVTINGLVLPITTTISWIDDPLINPSLYDYLHVTVTVGYRLGQPAAERVSLETLICDN